ncbi:MAG: hypothetical protein A4E59_00352 [Syntrophorhabdus sp. PtaB.Bin027]|jgi:hypothetical protein|nr:MAG: hypothetical protein A4E59_00352 [Syntrophorhabdus sp. PtaB.Bin027]
MPCISDAQAAPSLITGCNITILIQHSHEHLDLIRPLLLEKIHVTDSNMASNIFANHINLHLIILIEARLIS